MSSNYGPSLQICSKIETVCLHAPESSFRFLPLHSMILLLSVVDITPSFIDRFFVYFKACHRLLEANFTLPF